MSSYDEVVRRRGEANTLYRKLRFLRLEAYAEPDAERPAGYRVVVEGLKSLNPDHADRLMRLVRDNEAALAEVLPKRCPRLRLVRGNGPVP
ncbi:hypothetical protein RxyAA322_09320 [Rubrobacter xylanophilus]|uniref:Uncharacterized protein n=1 Tax=Rubrobacter xylanophilus TaxID=49319 RepID=A0A510HGP0_9ACTN|nr:hypothetical protein [Rubrobacter xylanophilus]BBL79078.1 hypothetical protein RxyAA322_09320 [Rubrobacter xylanophilus]